MLGAGRVRLEFICGVFGPVFGEPSYEAILLWSFVDDSGHPLVRRLPTYPNILGSKSP